MSTILSLWGKRLIEAGGVKNFSLFEGDSPSSRNLADGFNQPPKGQGANKKNFARNRLDNILTHNISDLLGGSPIFLNSMPDSHQTGRNFCRQRSFSVSAHTYFSNYSVFYNVFEKFTPTGPVIAISTIGAIGTFF